VLLGPAGSGKTSFALQKLCGVAARGGLAVYFSFEERFELLVDRIVMFRLRYGDEFEVIGPPKDPFVELERLMKQPTPKGVLVLFSFNQTEDFSLTDILKQLSEMRTWKWRAAAIDSINALELRAGRKGEAQERMRPALQELVDVTEGGGFLGVLISEESGHRIEELEYIGDTIIRFGLGSGDRSRWLEICKCRSQNYHGGRHLFRLIEGEGINITPSLGAIRSALRRRTFGTLRHDYVIATPENWRVTGLGDGIRDKSASLFLTHGNDRLKQALFEMVLTPLMSSVEKRKEKENSRGVERGPRSVLVVSFRTPEARFLEVVHGNSELQKRWNGTQRKVVRWFSPGETIVGEQVVWEIWDHIKKARRSGAPIDRILFVDVESVTRALPSVGREDLFWLTLFQLLGVEAVTSFWGFDMEYSREDKGGRDLDIIRSQVDYVLRFEEKGDQSKEEGEARSSLKVTVEKAPPPTAAINEEAEPEILEESAEEIAGAAGEAAPPEQLRRR
jgi:KaiC/GvpD/RAD55 family RecA-like ATPase